MASATMYNSGSTMMAHGYSNGGGRGVSVFFSCREMDSATDITR